MLSLTLALVLPAAATTAQKQQIWAVEYNRQPAAGLAAFVADEDPEVRGRAALALARLAQPEGLAMVAELLADPHAEVRKEAAFAAGQTDGGLPLIQAALEVEADPRVRGRLLAAAGLHEDPSWLPVWLAALEESRFEAAGAAQSLGRLGISSRESVNSPAVAAALVSCLDRYDVPARRACAFALARINPSMDRATFDDAVGRVVADHDPNARAWLVRGLTTSAADFGQGAVLLDKASKDRDRGVRVAAARAFAKLGTVAEVELLERLLRDENWSVRHAALDAAGRVESLDHKALLTPFLKGDPATAAVALRALGAADPTAVSREWLLDDKPLPIRLAAISSLQDPGQLQRLATKSPESPVRVAAAARLAELRPDGETARALLRSPDDAVAAIGLGVVAEAPEEALLAPSLKVLRSSADLDVWTEGMKALDALLPLVRRPPEEARQVVVEAQSHPSIAIRRGAAAPAALLGLEPPPPPPPVVLPPIEQVEGIVSARIFTTAGELRIRLRPDVAPATVHNFATLAEQDYFDGQVFHRMVPDFVVQDGCPRGDGWGGPGYQIPDELSWLAYDEGTVGMALSGPDTGGSQWFATLSPQPHLDSRYTVFGALEPGMSAVNQVMVGTTITDVVIERVTPLPVQATPDPTGKGGEQADPSGKGAKKKAPSDADPSGK